MMKFASKSPKALLVLLFLVGAHYIMSCLAGEIFFPHIMADHRIHHGQAMMFAIISAVAIAIAVGITILKILDREYERRRR